MVPKIGRPPHKFILTRTRLGDSDFLEVTPLSGAKEAARALNMRPKLFAEMIYTLAGEFTRKVNGEDGCVYTEHIKRVV